MKSNIYKIILLNLISLAPIKLIAGIDENINNLEGNEEEINLVSAITLVKKRSIGPYRKVEFTDKVKNREFGILSRAGFSYAISKRVLIDMDKNEIEGYEL